MVLYIIYRLLIILCWNSYFIAYYGHYSEYIFKFSNFFTLYDIIIIKVQKKFLLFWIDVDNGQTNNTWIDSVTGYQGSVTHSTGLSSTGNYRAVITYYVYGSSGDTDVIDITLYSDYE